MKKKFLRCGIIGTGTFAAVHAAAIKSCDADFVAGYDIDSLHVQKFVSAWGGEVAESLNALLHESLDLVIIATPNETHADFVRLMCTHPDAPRMAIVEKPLCTSWAELDDLQKVAASAKTAIIVDHTRRFNAGFVRLQNLIASNSLGNLLSARWRYYAGWLHTGVHAVDTLRMLIGDLQCLHANKKAVDRFPDDPLLDVKLKALKFPQAEVLLEGVVEHPYKVFEADLTFSKGRIRIDWEDVFIDRAQETAFGTPQLLFDEHFKVESTEESMENLYEMSRDFLHGKDRHILDIAGFDMARGTMEVLFDAQAKTRN